MMNEKKTRQEIVRLRHKFWQGCWTVECSECPYHKHGDKCFAYIMELGMKVEGFYNNNPNAEPIHETLIRVWDKGMKCYSDPKHDCNTCKWRQYYGGDCYEQYWARELYRAGWRKNDDTEKGHSTNQ